ncbi:MAG: Flp pilus assembly protein CpaB, partial [Planctomycetota bacterium]
MRAVSVMLPKEAVSGGLLYPGCVVDVIASFRLSGAYKDKGQAISTTLLHAVQVLAVDKKTIVSKQENLPKSTTPQRSSGRITVTLMVDPKQAEALQLAIRHGTISLAMRNPLDKYAVDIDPTVLSEGRLARLGSMLDSTVAVSQNEGDLAAMLAMIDPNDPNYEQMMTNTSDVYSQGQQQAFGGFFSETPQSSNWLVTVIRGAEVKEEEIEATEADEGGE